MDRLQRAIGRGAVITVRSRGAGMTPSVVLTS
jgi:hypothetical protein